MKYIVETYTSWLDKQLGEKYDVNLVSFIGERLAHLKTLKAVTEDIFLQEQVFERAVEDIEASMYFLSESNEEEERRFAQDILSRWDLITEKANQLFW